MSISQYVGPVLLAKQHPESEETFFDACSNTQCDLHRKPNQVHGRHCHQCGSEVKRYKGKPHLVRLPKFQQVFDILVQDGLDPQALWASVACPPAGFEEYVVYIPNNYLGQPPPRKLHSQNPDNLLLCALNPDGDLEWFQSTYEKHIDKMRELFDTVEIHWGIFNYMS
jgi:hypothetical protein